jgi:glycosyltransferase involved in cell wall biosynthesis
LHVVNLYDDGGAERFALGLATHLPRERFDVWVCSPRGAEPGGEAALAAAGIPLVTLGRRARWDVHRQFLGLSSLLRRERFDLLHAHMYGSNLWGTVLGRGFRVPVVIAHEQTWSYEGNPVRMWLDGRVIGRLATRFVAVSSADARRMVSLERVPADKVTLIPNAYVPHARASDIDLRAELGLPVDAPLVGSAVVMRAQKALNVLIDAHARVAEHNPGAQLALAGDGPERPRLERQARALGLESCTHFLGRRNDVDSILRQLDVAAMSSDYEGTPLFAFECMANGTPLVATSVGGLPDIVEDGRTGILVPPRNPEQLADAITALLRDPERRQRLADAARERLADYTIGAITERFVELYERLLAEKARDLS